VQNAEYSSESSAVLAASRAKELLRCAAGPLFSIVGSSVVGGAGSKTAPQRRARAVCGDAAGYTSVARAAQALTNVSIDNERQTLVFALPGLPDSAFSAPAVEPPSFRGLSLQDLRPGEPRHGRDALALSEVLLRSPCIGAPVSAWAASDGDAKSENFFPTCGSEREPSASKPQCLAR
jgi:hypothetical protein